MNVRPYDPERDKEAAHQIFREVDWIKSRDHEAGMDAFVTAGRTLVATVDDRPECLVASMPGDIHYLDEALRLSVITSVATSRVVRKRGWAQRLTAQVVAEEAADGAQVSGLGMFEQGFYNRLGFGTGGYEHWISFDPGQLRVARRARIPQRLAKDNWEEIHRALLTRRRGHGSCNLYPGAYSRAEMAGTSKGFGLGYHDGPQGELTHFIWGSARGENGPYVLSAYAYRSWDQLLELLALVKSWGDQVRLVKMREPAGIQLQDLIAAPIKYGQITRRSEFENIIRAIAYWQLRICDLAGCLAQTHLDTTPVQFNLALNDPITDYLAEEAAWRGVGDRYIVTLGPASEATRGEDPRLATLTASVGAFTRMWLGVRPASSLAVTDKLAGSPDLLTRLDRALRLPEPKVDWDF